MIPAGGSFCSRLKSRMRRRRDGVVILCTCQQAPGWPQVTSNASAQCALPSSDAVRAGVSTCHRAGLAAVAVGGGTLPPRACSARVRARSAPRGVCGSLGRPPQRCRRPSKEPDEQRPVTDAAASTFEPLVAPNLARLVPPALSPACARALRCRSRGGRARQAGRGGRGRAGG